MSQYLHGLAGQAALSQNLKSVLQALCDAAGEDDGTNCHPSLEYVSYKTGFSLRHVRRLLRCLEIADYIEPVAYTAGGRGHTTWYRIHIERVPMKPPWRQVKARLIEDGTLAPDEIPDTARRIGGGKPARKPRVKRLREIHETAQEPIVDNISTELSTVPKGGHFVPL